MIYSPLVSDNSFCFVPLYIRIVLSIWADGRNARCGIIVALPPPFTLHHTA